MDILTLCNKINLGTEIKSRVLEFADNFDFNTVDKQLKDFLIYEKMNDAQLELQTILGKDEDNIKILTCMLKASADAYEIYKTKGISDNVYIDTMKCYTRFINETHKMTGRLYFDRYWLYNKNFLLLHNLHNGYSLLYYFFIYKNFLLNKRK